MAVCPLKLLLHQLIQFRVHAAAAQDFQIAEVLLSMVLRDCEDEAILHADISILTRTEM